MVVRIVNDKGHYHSRQSLCEPQRANFGIVACKSWQKDLSRLTLSLQMLFICCRHSVALT